MLLNNRVPVLCSFFCIAIVLVCADDIGDVCRVNSKNIEGQCVLLRDCPHALNDLKQGITPQTCSFKGNEPVVCCEATRERIPGEISKQKCAEYGETVYTWEYPALLHSSNIPVKVDTCTSASQYLILLGTSVFPQEFPHMALIGFGEETGIKWLCSGTLISDQYVLTAAHCIHSRDYGSARWVRLGEYDINADKEDTQAKDFSILGTIVPPEYNPPSLYNDIALIKVNESVKFNTYIRPACLHTTREINETRFIATGWGNEYFSENKHNILRKILFDKTTQEQCNDAYKKSNGRKLQKGILPETQLCANNSYENDICQGDSGGPIQVYNQEIHCMYNVVGVTSFGGACGISSVPGIYTRVSAYIDWIEKIVWP